MKVIKIWVNNCVSKEFDRMLVDYIIDREVESRNKIWYTIAYNTRCVQLEYLCSKFHNLDKRIVIVEN